MRRLDLIREISQFFSSIRYIEKRYLDTEELVSSTSSSSFLVRSPIECPTLDWKYCRGGRRNREGILQRRKQNHQFSSNNVHTPQVNPTIFCRQSQLLPFHEFLSHKSNNIIPPEIWNKKNYKEKNFWNLQEEATQKNALFYSLISIVLIWSEIVREHFMGDLNRWTNRWTFVWISGCRRFRQKKQFWAFVFEFYLIEIFMGNIDTIFLIKRIQ